MVETSGAGCGTPLTAIFTDWATRFTSGDAGPVMADADSMALYELARRVAASASTVLIGGPSGAGKEVLARYLHDHSARAAEPFVAVNCATLPEAMLEALLFGHERGAFTSAQGAAPGLFRAACGGTLFLDEVGELPLGLQAKLLRAVQEREVLPLGATRPVPVDVRILAASNRDLFAMATAGDFREDLLWRIAVFPLTLKPLARRPDDIVPLAAALLFRHRAAEGRSSMTPPSEEALRLLVRHDWPGNVRELDNVLQRAVILAGDDPIDADCIRIDTQTAAIEADEGDGLMTAVKSREAEAIRTALAEVGGRRNLAARRLGISERTLRYKLAALAGRPRAGTGHAASRTERASLQ